MTTNPTHSSYSPSERTDLYNTNIQRQYAAYKKESGKYVRQYAKENTTEAVRDVAIPVLSSVAAGAATGAAVGLVAGCPGGPPGMAAGAGIGAVSGLIIGSVISGAFVYKDYKAWQKKYAIRELEESVRFCFDEDDVLRQFICPITNTIIKTPVMSSHGNFFEKDAIIEWIKSQMKAGRTPTCPLTRKVLSLDMIHDAPEASALICARLMRITNQESHLPELDRRVLEGLKALHSDLKRFVDKQHDISVQSVLRLKRTGKISEEKSSQEMARLHSVYYPEVA